MIIGEVVNDVIPRIPRAYDPETEVRRTIFIICWGVFWSGLVLAQWSGRLW